MLLIHGLIFGSMTHLLECVGEELFSFLIDKKRECCSLKKAAYPYPISSYYTSALSFIKLTLSKMDTFGTSTKCPSYVEGYSHFSGARADLALVPESRHRQFWFSSVIF